MILFFARSKPLQTYPYGKCVTAPLHQEFWGTVGGIFRERPQGLDDRFVLEFR